ncbi:ADP-ribose glycohydrolase OARD1-like [Polypterus senegalus]|uniref:ADP-ribose glycohydrolase OARD1-like n=1 Tax=Polypterus senegalus TaxID=55291 RepID=UPI0019629CAE|nr:ADP-ribose glycohydrolase OARD1-like [Polypterus senegalus]
MLRIKSHLTCAICFERFDTPVKLQCGHTYCERCIQQYFSGGQEERVCPQCRTVCTGPAIPDYALRSLVTDPTLLEQVPPITEINRDIRKAFNTGSGESLAVCVTEQFSMSSGVCHIFRKEFNQVEELKKQGKKIGEVAVLENQGRFLYYLVTRSKYNWKANYEDLEKCLIMMKEHCQQHGVHSLSMPRLSCGKDGLKWTIVSSLIKNVFTGTGINITIYYIDT